MPNYGKHLSAALHVQMRDYERQLINGALDAVGAGDVQEGRMIGKAANLLGVTSRYLHQRALVIGGFMGHPVYEPPRTGATKPDWHDPSEQPSKPDEEPTA